MTPTSSTLSSPTTLVICGLNPALQKRFVLAPDSSLVPGNVHRAAAVQTGLGGKGQDVAVTLSCLMKKNDEEPKLLPNIQLAQFIGRDAAGDAVQELVQEVLDDDDKTSDDQSQSQQRLTIRTEAGMRTCTSIVAADATTELVEPSGEITPGEVQALLEQVEGLVVSSSQDNDNSVSASLALCVMGSMPPGCPEDLYAQIYQRLAKATTTTTNTNAPPLLCLVDSVVGLTPLCQTMAATKSTTTTTQPPKVILKINASELCRLAHIPVQSEAGGVARSTLIDAVTAFLKQPLAAVNDRDDKSDVTTMATALDALAITDGAHPGYLVRILTTTNEPRLEMYQLPVPNLMTNDNKPLLLYPIGAGDAVAAGTLAAWKALTDQLKDDETTTTSPSSSRFLLPPHLMETLLHDTTTRSRDMNNEDDMTTAIMLTSFGFGMACGSASCLQEENSVLQVADVQRLYRETAASQTNMAVWSQDLE